ncbi:MAG: DNA internalization-related competence protein ComEC/Rec2 [Acidobacteriota bacterium]
MIHRIIKYPALLCVFPFIAGILCCDISHPPPIVIIPLLFLSITASSLCFAWSRPGYSIIFILLSFLLLGSFASSLRYYALPENHLRNLIQRQPEQFQNADMEISGRITAGIEPSRKGTFLTVDLKKLAFRNRAREARGRIRLFIPHDSGKERTIFRAGDIISAYARIRVPRNFGNPGAFDYRSYLDRQGINLTGSVKNHALIKIEKSHGIHPIGKISEFRQRLILSLWEMNAQDAENFDATSIILAMTLGSREGMHISTEKTLRMGGVYHIVAISGLHIGIIALALFKLFTILRIQDRAACLLTCLTLLSYLILCGGRSSALRAVIMSVTYLIARSLYRKINIMSCISLAAFGMLIFNPGLLYDPGFQLTFAATASLIKFHSQVERYTKWSGCLSTIIAATASAQIGVIPIIAYHFNTVTLLSLFTNIVAVPLSALIVPLGLAMEVSSLFSAALARTILFILDLLIKAILATCSLYVNLPFLSHRIPTPSPFFIILYYSSSLGILLSRNYKPMKIIFLVLFCFALSIIVSYPFSPEIHRFFEVTFIDVGQGEASLVVSPDGGTILIDGGGRSENIFDAGEMVVSRYLFMRGFKKVDRMIASHLHSDHAGGIPALIENFHVSEVMISEQETGETLFRVIEDSCRRRGTKLTLLSEDQKLSMGRAVIHIMNPVSSKSGERTGNERSLVVRIIDGNVRFLFMGDAPSEMEKLLIDSGIELNSEILKIGHHGSRDSSSERFLKEVNPRLCLISVGSSNQWGHPSGEVLARIERMGSSLFRTDRDGAVTVLSDGKSFSASSYINPMTFELNDALRSGLDGNGVRHKRE